MIVQLEVELSGCCEVFLHIGDDVITDLVGALDAGCRCVLLTRAGTGQAEGNFQILWG